MALGAYLNGTLYLFSLGVRGLKTRGYEAGRSPSGDQRIAAVGRIASAVGCIGDRGMAATATNTSHRLWAATVIEESRRRIAAVGGLRISAAGIEWVV